MLRVHRHVEIEHVEPGLHHAGDEQDAPHRAVPEHAAQAAARRARAALHALRHAAAPGDQHQGGEAGEQREIQAGGAVAGVVDGEAGDQRAEEARAGVHQTQVVEVARARLRGAEQAHEVLHGDVEEADQQAVQQCGHEHSGHAGPRPGDEHAGRAGEAARHQQPARAIEIGQPPHRPRQEHRQQGKTRRERADGDRPGAEVQRVQHQQHAARARAGLRQQPEREREVDHQSPPARGGVPAAAGGVVGARAACRTTPSASHPPLLGKEGKSQYRAAAWTPWMPPATAYFPAGRTGFL